MPAPIPAAVWKRREQQIHEMIQPRGGTLQHAKTILYGGHKTPAEVKRRLKIMDANGINIGVTHALGCTKPKFHEMVRKHNSSLARQMSPERRELFLLMLENGVSEKAALDVLRRSMKSRPIDVVGRLKILNQKLDFAQCGMQGIPKEFFGTLIQQRPLDRMRNSIRRLLRALENKNASRILDLVMPQWRRSDALVTRVEPRAILAKWKYLVKKGIEPSGNLLRQHSLATLKKGKVKGNRLSPEIKRNLLERHKTAVEQGLKQF